MVHNKRSSEPALNPVEVLKQVPGIGDKTAEQLLSIYPDLTSIARAPEEEISEQVKGISAKKAEAIKSIIKNSLPQGGSPLGPRKRRVVTDIEFVPSQNNFRPPEASGSGANSMDVKDLSGKTVGEVKRAVKFQDEPDETEFTPRANDNDTGSSSIFFPKKKNTLRTLRAEENHEVTDEEVRPKVAATESGRQSFATFEKKEIRPKNKALEEERSNRSGNVISFIITFIVGVALLGGVYYGVQEWRVRSENDESVLTGGETQLLAFLDFDWPDAPASGRTTLLSEQNSLMRSTITQASGIDGSISSTANNEVTVTVLNGSGISGAAGRAGNDVENGGFIVTNETNADRFDYQRSVLFFSPENGNVAQRVRDSLGSYDIIMTPTLYPNQSTTIVFVVGVN